MVQILVSLMLVLWSILLLRGKEWLRWLLLKRLLLLLNYRRLEWCLLRESRLRNLRDIGLLIHTSLWLIWIIARLRRWWWWLGYWWWRLIMLLWLPLLPVKILLTTITIICV